MWGLSEGELRAIPRLRVTPHYYIDDCPGIAKATLRKVAEEGERTCPHYAASINTLTHKGIVIGHYRRECPVCWAELRREAGL